MKVHKFKKGDVVPKFIAFDEGNSDCVLKFGQDIEIFENQKEYRAMMNDRKLPLIEAGDDCSGKVRCGGGKPNGLCIDYTNINDGKIHGSFASPVPYSRTFSSKIPYESFGMIPSAEYDYMSLNKE